MSNKSDLKWMYDVFLNFIGGEEDTLRNFISDLYSALSNAGVNTFIEDQKGEKIKEDILRAIEGSQISIIVFSQTYAESRWCLDELVKIMECSRNIGQLVIPVFYDVGPSDVRHRKGIFGEAFQRHQSAAELRGWEWALTQAANLSGWDVRNFRNDSQVIKEIVDVISIKLDKTFLRITDFPVGVEPRVQEVVQFLEKQSERACIVGISGMGGIGKTTIAKSIYNELGRKFPDKSFLGNIREIWETGRGGTDLQEQLLLDILKTRKIKIHNIELGKTMIKNILLGKRTLVVLDDVTKFEQLNALCAGEHELNAPGSVLIITTRDVRLLQMLNVDYVYEMEEMDESESLELFSWHAFKKGSPREDYIELSRNAVAYSGGLPVALEVLGSYLYEKTKQEWKSAMSKLERIPHKDVQKKLQLSYDGLDDDMEKDIFLDICCFFIGKDRAYVTKILDGCGLHAEIVIATLIEKSLLKVDKDNKLRMPVLLRDMGREIVRLSSPREPEKRSRLWFHKDVLDVLTEHTGTNAVEGLALKLQRCSGVCLNTNAFKKMKRLRLLQLDHVQLDGDYNYLPKQLRWVYWKGFPLTCIPDSFNQENVVAIEIKHSNLQLVWKEPQLLEKLKILNLSHSRYLVKTPDFSYLPNLEELILKDCPNLCEVHQSIGDLCNLLHINLKDCKSLKNLPRTIYKLKSLKTLILHGCPNIEKLEDIEQFKSLMYDVFLSFRGEDTRRNFISHLYTTLSNAGVNTFIDDEKLERGEKIKDDLFRAIEGSQISIVVFSERYAESRWCLDELVKIMECRRYIGQLVIPVFYNVDPSDVRRQKGTYGQAFKSHPATFSGTSSEQIDWKSALTEAGSLSGWDVRKFRNDSDVIKEIVDDIFIKLDKAYLPITNSPVGVEPRVQDVVQLLEKQSERACIVGISGMGGIGKTTIAKSIYNELRRSFANKSFLEDIRGVLEEKDRSRTDLQEQLLSDILKDRNIKIHSIEWGKTMIQKNLLGKKTLVVLDDVTNKDQLDALCAGKHELNPPGSVLIITTRDVRLLKEFKVDHFYEMKEMDESESLELFSLHAFKEGSPTEDFIELSKNVVAYCGGLPLALEVLGSCLKDRSKQQWKSALSKLERTPNKDVQKKLKLSYDGLDDVMVKDIFLDICCFFIGKDRTYVTEILDGCELNAEIGIAVLIERSLLKVEKDNKLGMHDLLRDMGRAIVVRSLPREPEKHSRLWFHKDVLDVLTGHTGTIAIEGLALKLQGSSRVCLNTNAFEKMKRLRLLRLDHVQLDGDYENLPKQLRWVYWKGFPLRCIPDSFNLENVVAIELKRSNLKLVWKVPQSLMELKILNLSHSRNLEETPDFSYLPNLEKLILKDCPNLSEVHQSIGDLCNLLLINIKDCTSLKNLPRTIYKLKSVKIFILSGCSKIEKLEEDIEQMESLTTLIADFTGIKHVPFSIIRSKSIGYISLCGHEGLARDVLPFLMMFWMSPTTNPLSCTQPFWNVSTSLVSMNVQNNNLSDLTPMLGEFSKVRGVCVQCCSESQLTQELRRILDDLCDVSFTKLERTLYASQVLEKCMGYYLIGMGCYHQVVNTLNKSITEGLASNSSSDFFLPTENSPYWLAYTGEGHSVLFQVPEGSDCHMKGMTLCVVYSSTPQIVPSECVTGVLIINYTNFTIHIYKRDTAISFKDEDWWGIMSNLRPGDNVEIFVTFGHGLTVKKTTVYLIFGQLVTEKMESSSTVKTEPSVKPKKNIFIKPKTKWANMHSCT